MTCRCAEIYVINEKIQKLYEANSELNHCDSRVSNMETESDALKTNLNLAVSQEFVIPLNGRIELLPDRFKTVSTMVREKVSGKLSELQNELQRVTEEDKLFHEEEKRRRQEEAAKIKMQTEKELEALEQP